MFKLTHDYTVDSPNLKGGYTRYTPRLLSFVNEENKQLYIDITGKDSAFSLMNSHLELENNVNQ